MCATMSVRSEERPPPGSPGEPRVGLLLEWRASAAPLIHQVSRQCSREAGFDSRAGCQPDSFRRVRSAVLRAISSGASRGLRRRSGSQDRAPLVGVDGSLRRERSRASPVGKGSITQCDRALAASAWPRSSTTIQTARTFFSGSTGSTVRRSVVPQMLAAASPRYSARRLAQRSRWDSSLDGRSLLWHARTVTLGSTNFSLIARLTTGASPTAGSRMASCLPPERGKESPCTCTRSTP